jgi:hypothetical protein
LSSSSIPFPLICVARLCALLEYWTKLYPTDFYAPGASIAFKALYETISGMPDLVHHAIKLEPFVRGVCDGSHSQYEDPTWEWAVQETDRGVLENDILEDCHYSDTVVEELDMDVDNALGPDADAELISISQITPEDEEISFSALADQQRSNSPSSTISSTPTLAPSAFTQSGVTLYNSRTSLPLELLPRILPSISPLSSIPEPEHVPFSTATPTSNPSHVRRMLQRPTRSASITCKGSFRLA